MKSNSDEKGNLNFSSVLDDVTFIPSQKDYEQNPESSGKKDYLATIPSVSNDESL